MNNLKEKLNLHEEDLNEMAYERSDAIDRCANLGKQFIEHFRKVFESQDVESKRHWASEMQSWLDDVKDIQLKYNKKQITFSQLVDWFFTKGSSVDIIYKDSEELQDAYNEFLKHIGKDYNVINALKDSKLLEESLKEDIDTDNISSKILNKPVKFKEKEYIISEVEPRDEDDIIITMKAKDGEEKSLSLKIVSSKGLISSDDEEVEEIIKSFVEVEDEVKEPEHKEDKEEDLVKQYTEQARVDFRNKDKHFYTLLMKQLKDGMILTDYENTYIAEYNRLKNDAIATGARNLRQTIASTYPGDVDELVAWLRDAVKNITVQISDVNSESTKKLIDALNARDGTDYKPQESDNREGDHYKIYLTSDEKIMSRMPKEVYSWTAKKNSGRYGSGEEQSDAKVYLQADNALTSNPLVKDLLLNYDFHLGSYDKKKVEEDVDSLVISGEEEIPEIESQEVVNVEEPTQEQVDNGMYSIISQELRDTLQDIETLKSIITTLNANSEEPKEDVVYAINKIIDERTVHVGMLQTILSSFDEHTQDLIDLGKLTLEEPEMVDDSGTINDEVIIDNPLLD